MNTKLLAGISLAAMAGSFWACGEGQINGKEFSDTIVESMYDTPEALESLKEQAKTDCWQNDPACAAMYGSYVDPNASNPVVSSAAVIMSSSSIYQPLPGVSSSSEEVINNHGRSSSSIVIIPSSSESGPASSETVPVTGLGSCKPTKTPINKGEGTTWSFTRNSSNGIAASKYQGSATYQWKFVGGSIPEDHTKFTSAEVTYVNSGKATASVIVTLTDGSSEEIQCSPLQVNGDPITCTVTAAGGDITTDAGVATWAATCSSGSDITSYVWDGTDAGPTGKTFAYTFAAKGDSHKPTLEVGNSDNTVITVPCPEVVATDASIPDYMLDGTTKSVTVPAGTSVVTANYAKTDIVWDGNIAGMSCNFYCQTSSNDNVVADVDGVAFTGKNYITKEIPCESLVENYQLKITTNMEITCGKQ